MKDLDWWRLIAHRHWITLRVFGVTFRVCARCTGYVSGFFLLSSLLKMGDLRVYRNLPPSLQLVPCVLLASPLAFDWLTHTWQRRESNNRSRYLTGFLVGAGIALLSRSTIDPTAQFSLSACLGGAITLVGVLGKVIYPTTA